METILVTGCAGYIGSLLVPNLLAQGYRVIGVDSFRYGNQQAVLGFLGHPNFELVELDVRDHSALKRETMQADCVIALAALVGAPVCDKNPEEARQVNEEAVIEMVRRMSPSQRLIYTNTNSGYGTTDGSREITEDDPLSPVSIYGKTKVNAEKVVLDRPNSVSLRLATVFGTSPRMRFDLLVNDFCVKLHRVSLRHRFVTAAFTRPEAIWLYEPHYKRNYVHIRDVVRGLTWATYDSRVDPEPWNGAYNFGLPEANLSKQELAFAVCDHLGLSRDVVKEKEGRDPDQRNYIVSNDRVLQTGFDFKYSLEHGIREVCALAELLDDQAVKRMGNA